MWDDQTVVLRAVQWDTILVELKAEQKVVTRAAGTVLRMVDAKVEMKERPTVELTAVLTADHSVAKLVLC